MALSNGSPPKHSDSMEVFFSAASFNSHTLPTISEVFLNLCLGTDVCLHLRQLWRMKLSPGLTTYSCQKSTSDPDTLSTHQDCIVASDHPPADQESNSNPISQPDRARKLVEDIKERNADEKFCPSAKSANPLPRTVERYTSNLNSRDIELRKTKCQEGPACRPPPERRGPSH
jgi:hypothetical protein